MFHRLVHGEGHCDHGCHFEVVEGEAAEETVADAVLLNHHQDGCVPRTETHTATIYRGTSLLRSPVGLDRIYPISEVVLLAEVFHMLGVK